MDISWGFRLFSFHSQINRSIYCTCAMQEVQKEINQQVDSGNGIISGTVEYHYLIVVIDQCSHTLVNLNSFKNQAK